MFNGRTGGGGLETPVGYSEAETVGTGCQNSAIASTSDYKSRRNREASDSSAAWESQEVTGGGVTG